MGLHVVLPRRRRYPLRRRRLHSPPPNVPPPPRPSRPSRPHPRRPQPLHGLNLRHNLRRDPPLRRRGDSRHPLVLAPEQNHLIPVAVLFSARHAPLRARVLLVVHLLPLPLPPPPPHVLHRPPAPAPGVLPRVQPINPAPHLLHLARIFAIFPNRGHSLHHAPPLPRLRLPILNRRRAAGRRLSVCAELPGGSPRLQLALPFWGFFISRSERWVQRNWRLGLQFCAELRHSFAVPQVLLGEALGWAL